MRLITTTELAEMLHMTPSAIAVQRHLGKGPPYHKINRKVLYSKQDVDDWLNQNRINPAERREENNGKNSWLKKRGRKPTDSESNEKASDTWTIDSLFEYTGEETKDNGKVDTMDRQTFIEEMRSKLFEDAKQAGYDSKSKTFDLRRFVRMKFQHSGYEELNRKFGYSDDNYESDMVNRFTTDLYHMLCGNAPLPAFQFVKEEEMAHNEATEKIKNRVKELSVATANLLIDTRPDSYGRTSMKDIERQLEIEMGLRDENGVYAVPMSRVREPETRQIINLATTQTAAALQHRDINLRGTPVEGLSKDIFRSVYPEEDFATENDNGNDHSTGSLSDPQL